MPDEKPQQWEFSYNWFMSTESDPAKEIDYKSPEALLFKAGWDAAMLRAKKMLEHNIKNW